MERAIFAPSRAKSSLDDVEPEERKIIERRQKNELP
jgi:hypothetical protein